MCVCVHAVVVCDACFLPCLTAKPGGRIRCQYIPSVDKVLFVDDYAVGCRKDLNGILLLDTALQPPVAKPEDLIHLELPVTEVRQENLLQPSPGTRVILSEDKSGKLKMNVLVHVRDQGQDVVRPKGQSDEGSW